MGFLKLGSHKKENQYLKQYPFYLKCTKTRAQPKS